MPSDIARKGRGYRLNKIFIILVLLIIPSYDYIIFHCVISYSNFLKKICTTTVDGDVWSGGLFSICMDFPAEIEHCWPAVLAEKLWSPSIGRDSCRSWFPKHISKIIRQHLGCPILPGMGYKTWINLLDFSKVDLFFFSHTPQENDCIHFAQRNVSQFLVSIPSLFKALEQHMDRFNHENIDFSNCTIVQCQLGNFPNWWCGEEADPDGLLPRSNFLWCECKHVPVTMW